MNVAVIDPLGTYEGGTAPAAFGPLGGIPIGGTTTVGGGTMSLLRFRGERRKRRHAEAAFLWRDDLAYAAAKDSKSPTNGDRPMAVFDAAGNQQSTGNVSWFFTVAGSPADYHAGPPVTGTPWIQRQLFSVSIVVCWKRNFLVASDSRKPAARRGTKLAQRNTTRRRSVRTCNGSPRALAMAVRDDALCDYPTDNDLDANPNHPINKVREDQWVMVVGLDAYNTPELSVAGIASSASAATKILKNHPSQPVNMLSLVGPDWQANSNVRNGNVVVIDGVTGAIAAPYNSIAIRRGRAEGNYEC